MPLHPGYAASRIFADSQEGGIYGESDRTFSGERALLPLHEQSKITALSREENVYKKLLLIPAISLVACSQQVSTEDAMIQIKGSDTMVNLAQAWAEQYMELNPTIFVAVTGGGSGTGIASLI